MAIFRKGDVNVPPSFQPQHAPDTFPARLQRRLARIADAENDPVCDYDEIYRMIEQYRQCDPQAFYRDDALDALNAYMHYYRGLRSSVDILNGRAPLFGNPGEEPDMEGAGE